MRSIKTDLDRSSGQGICIAGYPIKECETRSLPENAIQRDLLSTQSTIDQHTDSTKLSVSFPEKECRNETLCGGKGASLGLLASLASASEPTGPAFVVPKGFVLTTNAFKLQIQRHTELKKAIDNIALNIGNDHLQGLCKRAVDLFGSTDIEPETVQSIISVVDALRESHKSQCNNNNNDNGASDLFRVAVRSSAVGEDGVAASAAGQNETTLGCGTADEILQAVKNCWASLYSYQSVVYRLQNLQPISTQMAVVIQTMVPSECAGVLFTRHAVNNDPYKILISANYGLGEVGVVQWPLFTFKSYSKMNSS